MAGVEIDVGTETFTNCYADQDTATTYATGATHGTTFLALDDDGKGRALVTAGRVLDRQNWADGYTTFEERSVVQNIIDACIELAMALVDGSEVQTKPNTASDIASMSAGSVSMSFRRGIYDATRFPLPVQELLRDYLAGAGAAFTAKSTGVDAETIFPIDLGFNRGL